MRQQLLPVQMPTWQVNWLPPVGITMWSKFKPHMQVITREMGTTVLLHSPGQIQGHYAEYSMSYFFSMNLYGPKKLSLSGLTLTLISLVPEQIFICLFLLYERLSF